MGRWITSFFDRLFAVVGALLFSQLPLFMQQYTIRLAGHVAELQEQINAISKAAGTTGKSLEEYIRKFLASQDADFFHQGEIMQNMLSRFDKLASSLGILEASNPFTKPFLFLTHLDMPIAKSTLIGFTPGLPFTWEGGLYALVGLILGIGIFSLVRRFFRLLGMVFLPRKRQDLQKQ